MNKGYFSVDFKPNGTTPHALITGLKEYYTILTATYQKKNMEREADIFAKAVKELERIEELLSKNSS